jgi:hypothetical protein
MRLLSSLRYSLQLRCLRLFACCYSHCAQLASATDWVPHIPVPAVGHPYLLQYQPDASSTRSFLALVSRSQAAALLLGYGQVTAWYAPTFTQASCHFTPHMLKNIVRAATHLLRRPKTTFLMEVLVVAPLKAGSDLDLLNFYNEARSTGTNFK